METLEILPGEGEVKTIVKTRLRRECDICGEPAHYKHTFLVHNARNQPASSAYRRDDCTWCQDAESFVCAEHEKERRAPDGMSWCSTFRATEQLAHLFLYWHEAKQ